MNRLTRRGLLRFSASALLGANLWPGTLRAADAKSGAFRFVVINDLHTFDGKCGPWLEKVAGKVAEAKPELVLLAGDLADGGTKQQLGMARDAFAALKVPVKITPGNHDWIKQTDRSGWDDLFPDALNYTFEHRGWQFLAIDSTDGTKAQVNVLKPALDYLAATAPKLDRKAPLILVTHFPLGPGVNNRVKNAEAVLGPLKEHNLRAVFGGHHHGFTEKTLGDTVLTTNVCCSFKRGNHDGTKQKGFFVCDAAENRVKRQFVEIN
jgi:3',5'-cyclic AMP phosphodiesterase CpdA